MENTPNNLSSPEIDKGKMVKWFLILGVLSLLPALFQATPFADYLAYTVVRMMILGIYAMSYDLLFGFTGIFSYGHAAF